jgi:CubicO group peptidase (beta-lactamase class C family)
MQVTLANWRTAPFNRWAFHHVRELVPSADIAHDPAAVRALAPQPMALPSDLETFLGETDTDGMAIVRRGRLVFERYANGMTDETPHILMSVSKSVLGLLVAEIGLDVERRITDFMPELGATAYRGATLRQLLDMRAGIVWNEDYLASSGPIVEYRKATGWNPLAAGDTASDLHSFLKTLNKGGPHGGPLHYVSPNSDLLGLLIERAMGRRYAGLLSELVWKKVGAERSAYITVDRLGAPRCAGGLCVTLRDLARLGQWLIEQKSDWLEELETDGDAAAWAAGDLAQYYPGLPIHYRSKWYVVEGRSPLVFGMGIHGQNLFVDRANELVIAKLSSQALPLDGARISRTMRVVSQLRELLA